ncbi:OLC1v1031523C1 [Oldenlandia corymbosa var. corymbosa]|uniref:OLC1v1031523C1 n=1 Tax=Oldenlandia corymbosa var. corymbosa TaxID=529605 RepID=A0AAV1CJI8_OLDCO|nr:OLC1v1031523C1 [Oldenlandia corymbosa var. corymbosa]
MDSTKPVKRHCFNEEDDGLASLADMEAGFSGNIEKYPLVSRPLLHCNNSSIQRRNSLRSFSSVTSTGFVSSPRSVNATMRFYEEPPQPHFLDACFLCQKLLGANSDIFMYRGDTPFCSEECRQEQIEMDEAKEKSWNLSASMRAMRKKDQRKSSSPNKTARDCTFRTSTVAAA